MNGFGNDSSPRLACSVIIPCWNDAAALQVTLAGLSGVRGVDEVVVADASQSDECQALAILSGAKTVRCARPNRGAQLNAGARIARGDIFLFNHADTSLRQEHLDALHAATKDQPHLAGGAFHRKFDQRHPRGPFFETIARFLAKRGGTFYGDQSIFVRREVFERLGGFAEIPLMEDIEFSGRLQRSAQTTVLDPPISSSPRHHLRRGALRASLRNGLMIALYRLGFPPDKLHAWYYRKPVF